MLDLQILRKQTEEVANWLSHRPFNLDIVLFKKLEEERKLLQSNTQQLQASRNNIAKAIGMAKSKGENTDEIMAQSVEHNQKLEVGEKELQVLSKKINEFLSVIPNIPHESVPIGKTLEDNQIISTWGEPKKFDFTVQEHVEIGERFAKTTNGLDFAGAVKIASSRFVIMQGSTARLHRALTQFMLDTHIYEHGYTELYTPYMVNPESAFGTGQLPKFENDLFRIDVSLDDEDAGGKNKSFYLIPTAEIPVTNIVRDEIVELGKLPLKFVCHTPCFRAEAGSYGKDTRGIIRQHQFDKVELVQMVSPEKSYEALEELTSSAENILKKLELPYRKVLLCTGDMGFSAAKTYDLEVWVPSQNTYREISSCSNFEAFQARRMKARFRNAQNKPELLHTLNGSGLAVGRALVAVIENNQNADGSINIPKVLQKYCGDFTKINAEGSLE